MPILDPPALSSAPLKHMSIRRRRKRGTERVWAPNDADDEIIGLQAGPRWRLQHSSQGLVTENQPAFAAGRRAVLSRKDLAVRAAYPERKGLDQDLAVGQRGLRDVFKAR